ncbi:hypothetical protein TIFTF001_001571 [Ficus carica]|uniref:Uncharacterized protein n=1 Tax=Ficus carica TaxID=3494 RepID=A0AA87Z7Y7_FICCA|nr:hypothetical protein TIFTF001_001571 [Ficus carica]
MAITKRARIMNVVDQRPADLNEDQVNEFEGGGSDDLDLAQVVRVLMEKQRITLKSKMQEWGKMAEKTLTEQEALSEQRGRETENAWGMN